MHKNYLSFGFIILTLLLQSCGEEDNPKDLTTDLIGTYLITNAESSSSIYEDTINDQIIVSKVNDTHVDVLIDFSFEFLSDISLNNISIVETTSENYDLDMEFSNAVVVGQANAFEIKIRANYTNGDFVDFEGSK